MILLTSLAGCETVKSPVIVPYSELYQPPSRPILQKIVDPIQDLGDNLIKLTSHVEKLEEYIKGENEYYNKVLEIMEE